MEDTAEQTLLPGENIYEMIGRLHNEGLDYVFDQYFGRGATKAASAKSKEEFIDNVIKDGVIDEFLKSKGFSEGISPSTKAQVQHSEVSFSILAEERNCQYYSELESLMKDSAGLEDFQESVKVFIEKISSDDTLDVANKEALMVGANILSSSTDYWSQNVHRWRNAFSFVDDETAICTKGMLCSLRVVDKRGNGIGLVSLFTNGSFVTQTNSNGYVYNNYFAVGQSIVAMKEGYKPAEGLYSGLNMELQMDKDNSGAWSEIIKVAIADGVGGASACAPLIDFLSIPGAREGVVSLAIYNAVVASVGAFAGYCAGQAMEN